MLGNGRLEAFCFDGVNRLCHIRGKLRKRVWIGVGDIVLLGLREFQDQKADIILKYDGDEARSLKTYGELPETVQINAGAEMLEGEEFGDDNFDFDVRRHRPSTARASPLRGRLRAQRPHARANLVPFVLRRRTLTRAPTTRKTSTTSKEEAARASACRGSRLSYSLRPLCKGTSLKCV